jgi:adenosine deaminase
MAAAGMNMCLNSDDPALIGPELHECFIDAASHLGWTVEEAEEYSLAGLDACFADDATVARLRVEFSAELERIGPLAYADQGDAQLATRLTRGGAGQPG